MKSFLLVAGFAIAIHAGAEEIMDISPSSCGNSATSFNCVKYVKNHDGDTFTVDIPSVHPLIGDRITVRVDGIDSPEMDSDNACERAAAIRAQHSTEKFLSTANRIDLKDTQRDKYFRILANVKADGKSLADHLIRQRLAVPYDGGTKGRVNWCRR